MKLAVKQDGGGGGGGGWRGERHPYTSYRCSSLLTQELVKQRETEFGKINSMYEKRSTKPELHMYSSQNAVICYVP